MTELNWSLGIAFAATTNPPVHLNRPYKTDCDAKRFVVPPSLWATTSRYEALSEMKSEFVTCRAVALGYLYLSV